MGLGRPRKSEHGRHEKFSISIDPDVCLKIDAYAEGNGLTVSEVYERGAILVLQDDPNEKIVRLKGELEEVMKVKEQKEREIEDLKRKIDDISSQIRVVEKELAKAAELSKQNETGKAEFEMLEASIKNYSSDEQSKAWKEAAEETKQNGQGWAGLGLTEQGKVEQRKHLLKKLVEIYGDRTAP